MDVPLNTISDLCDSFLVPFKPLLADESITDIWRNGNGKTFVAAGGRKRQVECLIEEEMLVVAIRQIGRLVSKAEISRKQPILDARLLDGSRINAVLFPLSQPGSQMSIRKFRMQYFTLERLVSMGSVHPDAAELLKDAVWGRKSILICGATGSGKTTMLNALVDMIDPEERLCIVEDTAELQVNRLENVVRLEERKEQPGVRAVSLRELVKATLRQAPDRIVLGEVRDGAAFDLVTAMTTGHDGTISTIHANTAAEALDRLVTLCQMADVNLGREVIERLIGHSLHFVVHMDRTRRLNEVLAVEGVAAGQFKTRRAWPL